MGKGEPGRGQGLPLPISCSLDSITTKDSGGSRVCLAQESWGAQEPEPSALRGRSLAPRIYLTTAVPVLSAPVFADGCGQEKQYIGSLYLGYEEVLVIALVMFQRLNNMFVGEINNLPGQEPEFNEKEEEEWILVDFIDSCTNFSMVEEEVEEQEEEEEEDEEEDDVIPEVSSADHSPVFSCLPTSLECLADASESCFIQFDSCPMEESWFITPPPCFTAGGLTTIKVETSPLENLLIEHPSMSVYAVHNTCHSLNKTNCGEEEEEEEEEDLEEEEEEVEEPHDASNPRTESQSERGQHIPCYIAALAAHSSILDQTKSFRPAQWIKEHNERQYLNRNCLRRQNLARDCYSRQLKNNGLFVHQPCQRQYNY
ncbi:hypothetical protein lerEdw1_008860 [Lerista edwardsae]|nr:hypothetical protein lerEdw1_008860 [Lerista edwardsae]